MYFCTNKLTPRNTRTRRTVSLGFGTLLWVASLAAQQAKAQEKFTLKPTPKTVAYGYYDAKAKPVLRIKSGDTVDIQTLITSSPKRLEGAGVPHDQVEQSLRDITDQVKDKGPGGHILTGPIYIEGAEIGDVLEVRILAAKLAIPYAYNAFGPGRGFLPEDYPYPKMKIIPLDEKRMVARFAPGIEIPLHPFFGSMGDAPPETSGRLSSVPPWIQAGNLDNKDLVAGTTLYIPVHAPGALFEVGDGHAEHEQTAAKTFERSGTRIGFAAANNLLKEYWPTIFKSLRINRVAPGLQPAWPTAAPPGGLSPKR